MEIIKEAIHSLGTPATYTGFKQLIRCVEIAVENEGSILHLQKCIYSVVAAEFNTERKNVERNLRTLINYIWDHGDHKRLNELAGYNVRMKPPAGEMISILAEYVTQKKKTSL